MKPVVLPVRIKQLDACFVILGANGVALAYVYFTEDESRRAIINGMTKDQARAVAQSIARGLSG